MIQKLKIETLNTVNPVIPLVATTLVSLMALSSLALSCSVPLNPTLHALKS